MSKKAKISYLILVWGIVFIQIFVNNLQKKQMSAHVEQAIATIDLDRIDEEVNGYGYLGTTDLTQEAKKKMLGNLASKFGFEKDYSITEKIGDSYKKLVLYHASGNTEVTMQFVSMKTELTEEESKKANVSEGKLDTFAEHYILVHVYAKDSVKQAKEYYNKVKKIYQEIGVEGTVNLELYLERPGNQMEKTSEQAKKMLDFMNVDIVKQMALEDIYTIYGYTKKESHYLMQDGKKTNIQLIMRYDAGADKTYIKLGIPMVNSPY